MAWIYAESNPFSIIERIVIAAIAIFIFCLFVLANKKISKDKNLTIDKMDKIIFFLAFIQIGILAIYFLLYTSTFFLASIRACRLIQEVFLCMLLSYIIYEERVQEIIFKIVIVFVVIIAGFWFTIAIIYNSSTDYNCKKNYWMTFSASTFFVSLMTIYFGFNALKIIQNCINNNNDENNALDGEENRNRNTGKNLDELKNRKIQIYVIILCSFISSFTQFIWDLLAHHHAKQTKDCTVYYVAHNFGSLIIYIFFKFLTLFLSALSIYYTFYWRNKKNLEIINS